MSLVWKKNIKGIEDIGKRVVEVKRDICDLRPWGWVANVELRGYVR